MHPTKTCAGQGLRLPLAVRQYLVVTGNYWAFTLTDGALRMLVVLHFHELDYSPPAIATLFLFYELYDVVINLVGGCTGHYSGGDCNGLCVAVATAGNISDLLIFGVVFAIDSSLHSFLIVRVASEDGVSLDVGFYYMANAMGRLVGTVLSGWLFQAYGLTVCLWVSAGFILITSIISFMLPRANHPLQERCQP